MFGKKTIEEEIVIEADKIASLKENFDAMSWSRVSEIAVELQKDLDSEKRQDLSRELMAISHANTDLLGKLGISETEFSGKIMPSGIEMLEEGIALDSGQSGQVTTKKKERRFGSNKASEGLLPDLEESMTDFFSAPYDDSSFIPRGVPSSKKPTREPVDLTPELVMDVVSNGEIDIEPEVLAALLEELGAPCAPQAEPPLEQKQEEKSDSETLTEKQPKEKKQSFFSKRAEKKERVEEQKISKQDFARFAQIYSSKDGSLCLYRDGDGHIVAVDTSKLA